MGDFGYLACQPIMTQVRTAEDVVSLLTIRYVKPLITLIEIFTLKFLQR